MTWRFYISLLSILFLGCQSTVDKSNIVNTKPNPRWILEPPADNDQFIYGVGEGNNRTMAIQAALVDISSKINITIDASFENNQTVSTRVVEIIKTDSNRKVRAKISGIKINHYLVEEIFTPLPTKVYLLVKTNRKKLFNTYVSLLDNHIKTFEIEKKSLHGSGQFANFQFLKKSVDALDEFEQDRLIVASLQPQTSLNKYLNFEQNVKKQLRNSQKKIRFKVQATDQSSLVFAKEVQNILGKDQLLADGKSNFTVKISTSKSVSKSLGFTVQNYLVNLMIYEKNQLINSHQVTIKHIGASAISGTPVKVIKQFNQKLPPILDW